MKGNAADTHVSAVILDLDGTLLNTEVLNKDVLKDYLAKYGKVVDQKKEDTRSGMSHKEFRLAIIIEYDLLITPEQFTEEIRPMYRERWLLAQALPGANRLIKHLYNQKVPVAVASNSMTSNVEAKISHQPGWTKCFPIVLGSDQVKSGKPSPDIFLEAANRMGVNAACCLVIEDSLIGVKAAKAAGMKVVAVPSLHSESGQFSVADMVLNSLLDLQPEVWGLPPFEDWISGIVPIEPIHVGGLHRKGYLHEFSVHGASGLPDQVLGVYIGWAKLESPKILKILMTVKWDRDCCSLEKVILFRRMGRIEDIRSHHLVFPLIDMAYRDSLAQVRTLHTGPTFLNTPRTRVKLVCPIDESIEASCDQKMQIMLVGYIGGQCNMRKSSSEKEILEEDKVIARTALDTSSFTHHSCMPSLF